MGPSGLGASSDARTLPPPHARTARNATTSANVTFVILICEHTIFVCRRNTERSASCVSTPPTPTPTCVSRVLSRVRERLRHGQEKKINDSYSTPTTAGRAPSSSSSKGVTLLVSPSPRVQGRCVVSSSLFFFFSFFFLFSSDLTCSKDLLSR